MQFKTIVALATGIFGSAQVFADAITIDFEAFDGEYAAQVADYYSGLGVNFSSNAITLSNNDGIGGYYPDDPGVGGAVLAPTYIEGFDEDNASLNVAGGFDSVSFWYNTVSDASVGVYDGLYGTGTLLYTFTLLANPDEWSQVSQAFGGIAKSLVFGGADNVAALAAYDNVTVNTVPLPAVAWLLMSGLGGLVAARRRIAA